MALLFDRLSNELLEKAIWTVVKLSKSLDITKSEATADDLLHFMKRVAVDIGINVVLKSDNELLRIVEDTLRNAKDFCEISSIRVFDFDDIKKRLRFPDLEATVEEDDTSCSITTDRCSLRLYLEEERIFFECAVFECPKQKRY
ncbi:hypothetical protein QR680_014819 [Steinernema hermaphroditum]|uniref:Uncharacterized protein n=1 Tax=Steinernema hermaphroditum TaxID=289476 RepID=A0AA39IBT6_9BILA|nr:hypothetical protein QR680_014819 [Steinernema hermaphroditum]